MSQFLKQATSFASQSTVFEKFVTLLEKSDLQRPGLLRVLTYHRVDKPEARPWMDPGLISASPKAFQEQIKYLASHYNVIPVTDVIRAAQSGNSEILPSRAVLVTFDDAYCDFEEHAWPVLKQYDIPSTLFVPTAYPDQPQRTFWWDDLYHALQNTVKKDNLQTPIGYLSLSKPSLNQTYKILKNYIKTLSRSEAVSYTKQLYDELGLQATSNNILGWDSLRKLANDGVTLGAHTRTHPLMSRVSLEEAREEAVGSLKDLEREIGSVLPIFAYPSGEFNDDVVTMLKREGFELAFATLRGINNLNNMDSFRIRRINVGGRTSMPILRAQLLPWMMHLNRFQTFTNS